MSAKRRTSTPETQRLALQPAIAPTVALLPIAALKPDPRNPRRHPERHVQQLARSIETFGFTCPLLIDGDSQVVAGHGRLAAVQRLGWTEVPVIRLEHLTPQQVQAYRIADNRLNELSDWDERLLAEQLKALADAELDFDLEAVGFDLPEIDLRISSLDELGDADDGAGEAVDVGPSVSVLGDLWQLGPHRILCGSALESMSYEQVLSGQRAAVVFCDPPFNIRVSSIGGKGAIQHPEFAMASGEMSRPEFIAFLGTFLQYTRGAVADGALLYVCMDWRNVLELATAGEAQALELKNIAIWDKGCGGMGSLYRSQHEMIFVFKSGSGAHTNNVQLGRFGRNRTNIWQYPGVNSFARKTDEGNLLELHPTVKPVALVADALRDASDRGDLVLDPFLGSGTTVIAAEKTGRVGAGIELDPRYVDVAVRRWQRLTGQAATHAQTGQSFDAMASVRANQPQSEEVAA